MLLNKNKFSKKRLATALIAAASLLSISFACEASDRWTFDGNIRNNSLAISPNETIVVASYS